MLQPNQLSPIEAFAKQQLAQADPGHDLSHALRVRRNAMMIGEQEGGDPAIIALAALLHDLADPKIADPTTGLAAITHQLSALNQTETQIAHIVTIIQSISFTHEKQGIQCSSKECKIVQDADRLDAIGAIGIARTFSYGGKKMRPLWNEAKPTNTENSITIPDESTIQHFYDKLLKLKDLMKTDTGRGMAEERHRFMELFLQHFFEEWGESR